MISGYELTQYPQEEQIRDFETEMWFWLNLRYCIMGCYSDNFWYSENNSDNIYVYEGHKLRNHRITLLIKLPWA